MGDDGIDWRALFGRYMAAAEHFELGAGDAHELLSGDLSAAELAALVRLHAEVFPPRAGLGAEPALPYHRICLGGALILPTDAVNIFDALGAVVPDHIESVYASPEGIIDACLSADQTGRQTIIIRPLRIGSASLTAVYWKPVVGWNKAVVSGPVLVEVVERVAESVQAGFGDGF